MRLQVDNGFQQVKIKDLKNKNNVDMFTSLVRRGKAFTAEQKIRELKTRIWKLNAQKLKISPSKIIPNSALNMNLMKSVKYGLSPEEIESRSLTGGGFKTLFNIHQIQKILKLHRRLDKYDVMKYSAKRKKLRVELFIGERVLVLTERIKKESCPRKVL